MGVDSGQYPESSDDKDTYEQRIRQRFGRQKEFAFMIQPPKESAAQEPAN